MLTTPVVLISFNRPELTDQAMNRIRAAAPRRLFLIADGPRPDHPGDVEKCAAVRAVLEGVDWPCEVRRRYNETNRGCETTVETGLDWVFDHVQEAVILEDDCLPGPSFFAFCAELLDRYRDDARVAQISGTSLFVPPHLFQDDSYAFGSFAGVWGWATWRRAWQEHREGFPRRHCVRAGDGGSGSAPHRLHRPELDRGHVVTKPGRRYFNEVADSTDPVAFGWDSHWYLSTASLGRLTVTPAVNLVENVGFAQDATHTQSTRKMPAAQTMSWPLRHPDRVALSEAVERELELVLVRANGRLARRLRTALPHGPLRTVARTLATGRPTTRVMHALSSAGAVLRRSRGQSRR